MQNNEEHDSMSTSNYHLSARQIFSIVAFFLILGGSITALFFIFRKQGQGDSTASLGAEAPISQESSYLSPEYIERLAGAESSVSIIYPPEYELVEATDAAEDGLLKNYVFLNTQINSDLPKLLDFSLSSADSLGVLGVDSETMKTFELEKNSLEQQKELDGRQFSVFENILFLVQNVPSVADGAYIREYVTFAGGTRIQIRIAMPSPSFSMQADELFRQVHLVAVKSE
ncbi:MAG: hypothetical protein G01um101448_448 [Parcubacteria group bacterium Gr01-1014_48]|nr:MAG: hypothetical protein Greene041614_269 [Parcubacteria group bacterium Greene0416_14]TSC73900.1 MAG: hypothetical protein G01um101448_448 [Parcubacteria group bacterium Gr01-1014_48]TSC99863.1 MAG: hypothetical protein Greene101415_1051 [Parcubacteria group bacterium Greene1014_15]TSD06979.1 MAG: hypothetical protein Greene07144_1034 [Parcubacteria group bacterium Greene0714_4]